MGWTNTTLTNLTEDGSGDLVLDAGEFEGICETTAQDETTCTWRRVSVVLKVEENPADTGEPTFKIEISISENASDYGAYTLFQEGEYYCRAYKIKVTVYGEPSYNQCPKITRLESYAPPVDTNPILPIAQSSQNAPPAGGLLGDVYRVGVGSGDWSGFDGSVMRCIDAEAPTYRRVFPANGVLQYNNDTDLMGIYDPAGSWVDFDVRKTAAPHITMMAPSWSAVTQGTWAAVVDANQLYNGYFDNSGAVANGDEIKYRTGLRHVAYTLVLFGIKDDDMGIVKVYLDSTLVATFDMYAAALAQNVEYRQTSITPAAATTYDVKVKVDGQNASSSGYRCAITYIAFYPE